MGSLAVALRAMHFAAALALFGGLAFQLLVAREPLQHRAWRLAAWALALVFVSGAGWLWVQAAAMSGRPLGQALDAQTLGTVLGGTLFGRVWEIRFVLAALLGALLLQRLRTGLVKDDAVHAGRASLFDGCAALLAGGLLGTLAWAGHAAADQGIDRVVHLSADVVHLLAAGTWLGALAPLACLLARVDAPHPDALRRAARIARRFSLLGLTSVAALVLTGTANAWYTVGSWPALFGTGYGRLLLLKLALFGGMLALAAINRIRLTPRLADPRQGAGALRALRRNAIAETALGLAVVGVVASLGLQVPGAHRQPVWPFGFTLDWEAAQGRGLFPRISLEPAYPSSYFRSPVGFSTDSIARGGALYGRHCAVCHGAEGYGDGPAAASLAERPANLREHFLHHREGDVFWWVQHGIPGTPMPAFGERIDANGLWDLLNFVRLQAEAEEAKAMDAAVEPFRAVVAPDFIFQIGHSRQESLAEQRGRSAVLLVFYTSPASLPRLRALSFASQKLRSAGVRVISMAMHATAATPPDKHGIDPSIVADPDAHTAAAYRTFGRIRGGRMEAGSALHLEFLIDRRGFLRARASGTQGLGSVERLLRQAQLLSLEKPHSLPARTHVH